MKIRFLEQYGASFYACGIIEKDTIFTSNEFKEKFGINQFDIIEDSFLDENEETRRKGVEMWIDGMHIEVCEKTNNAKQRYKAKIEELRVELYPTDADIKERIIDRQLKGEKKATYIKRLIREDIKKDTEQFNNR